ncbi:MAG: hypothetical protein J2O48_13705 [Solirubrobacterales bacterium]|nr:hypothetical protein [Solirubrobacterales bacterium]
MTEIVVRAPARLHFGMLDPAGLDGRRFGGFGVGVESPRVVVHLESPDSVAAGDVLALGPQAERAERFARHAASTFGFGRGLQVRVEEAIPPHAGLGSGTKLGIAVARGVAALAGLDPSPEALARASGRGARSSVGLWTFAETGLVVEAGVRDQDPLSPVVTRHPMPCDWRCVLALAEGLEGLSGVKEERFFDALGATRRVQPNVARRLLTGLLPGLMAGDIEEFGAALTAIQREVGQTFAPQQGGIFHPSAAPLVDALLALDVKAVGQSSWGPSVYGIVDGPDLASRVARELAAGAPAGTRVNVVDFDRHGGTVERRLHERCRV